jgi:hypothetical protein
LLRTKRTPPTLAETPSSPPWVLDAVIEARTDDPFKLILAVNSSAIRFNKEQQALNENYIPNTAPTLNHFVIWAWGVKKNLIVPTTFFIDPNDTESDNYQILCHQLCIQPFPTTATAHGLVPPPGAPPIFTAPTAGTPTGTPTAGGGNDAILQQLTISISRQTEEAATHNELFARQLEHNMEKEDKKKDRLKKFHSSVKQLILFASASQLRFWHLFFIIVTKIVLLCLVYYQIASYNQ